MKSVEAGLNFETVTTMNSEIMLPKQSLIDCLSESVNTKSHDPDPESMGIEYFISCLWILSFIVLTGVIVLLSEKIFEYVKTRQNQIRIIHNGRIKSCEVRVIKCKPIKQVRRTSV